MDAAGSSYRRFLTTARSDLLIVCGTSIRGMDSLRELPSPPAGYAGAIVDSAVWVLR